MISRRVNIFTLIVVCVLLVTRVQAQEPPTLEPPTVTAIPTDLPTLPPTATDLPTITPFPTETSTLEPSFTPLPLPTETETATVTPSLTATDLPTLEPTLTPSLTVSVSLTATASATASLTPSLTASATSAELVGAQNVEALNVTCDPSASIQQGNVSSTGEEGNVSGNLNSLSADGRYLYFPSRAANLVAGDTNGMVDYFEFDRTNCQTRRITVGSSGEQGDGDSDVGNVSGNGLYFAFASKASNFATGDTNGKYDIFVKNLQMGAVTRIPADPDNLISTAYYIGDVTISDDGRYVAFDVVVSNGGPGSFSGTPVVFDLQTSTRTVIASEGRSLYISGDGNYIAFVSSVSTLVGGDTNNVDDVFIYERSTGNKTRASVMTDGTQSFFAQEYPSISISGDGRYVSFTSLVPFAVNDTNNASDVYVRDRLNNTTTLVSLQNNGTLFAGGGLGTRLSADGRFVVFFASGGVQVRDLVAGQTYLITNAYPINGGDGISADGAYLTFSTSSGTPPNNTRNVYVARRLAFALATPTPTLNLSATRTPSTGFATCSPSANLSVVSVSSSGTLGNQDAGQWNFALSNNARYVYYVSSATNLVSGDTNNADDIFRFDRETCQTIRVSTDASGNQTNNTSSVFGVSENGQVITFSSSATNLIAGDPNGGIFVRNLTNNTIIRIPNSTTSGNPSISADGRYVAYTSPATASSFYVMLYDTQTAQSITAATTSTQTQWAKISSDGSTILYHSTASTLGVYDRATGVNTGLNFNVDLGSLADISANGRYIVFVSDATNLVPNDTNAKKDTFVYDRQTSQFVRASVNAVGAQAAANSGFSSISPDGRYVSFVYNSNDVLLNPPAGNLTSNVFVRDLVLGKTYLVSTGDNGQIGNNGAGGSWLPFSSDNQYLVFPSFASNLIANDLNVREDVFITKLWAFQANDFGTATAAALMTQTAVAQGTATAVAPMTQTAVAQGTAMAAIPMTQTAAAQGTATAAAANTIVVNTTSSSSSGSCTVASCTLAQAVALSNGMHGVQTITFNIPGTGVKQIILLDSLRFTSSAILDASTQPGYAGSPLIEIIPSASTSAYDAIIVNGVNPVVYDPTTSVTIRGVAIGGFAGSGILLGNGQNHVIEDSYIGTNAAGTASNANYTGIFVRAPNSIIRNNLISGNDNVGLYIYSNGGRNGDNNIIAGNFIGTDVTGEYALPNNNGIRLTEGATGNVVGGITAAEANLISANRSSGILIDGNSNANVVEGNVIGLDSTGDYLLGNAGAGILISQATNTVIGGDTAASGNEIWGNVGGIALLNQSDNTIIRNNVIAQNGTTGISVGVNGTQIIENMIAFHTNVGLTVSSGTGNRISMNRIFSNDFMGIDLGSYYSVLPNDSGDVDNGANGLQNYPVLTSVTTGTAMSTISGSLNSKPNSTYRVEFFTNNVCDATGYGEGRNYLGYTDVTTNANGVATFAAQFAPINSGSTFGSNWSGTFYASTNLSGTAVNAAGIDGLNFNWGNGLPIVNGNAVPGMPADNFSARFTSTQYFAAGTYNFVASSDDGVRVYVDGVLRLDKFVGRALTTDQFSLTLAAGTHNLVVEYFEGIDSAALQFSWLLNGSAPNVITSTATDLSGNTSSFSACRAVQTVLGVGSIQENSNALTYQGTWMNLTGAGNGGSFKYTTDPNARVSFWVDSSVTRVTFYRTIHPAYGSTQIYLDNSTTPFATMVNTSPTTANGIPYTINLPAGGHRIELRNVGTAYSSLDQIDLLGAAVPLSTAPGTYQDTDTNLTFTGNWIHNPMVTANGGSRRYTNDPNGRVTFKVDNSVGRILVYRTLYQTGAYGSMQVFVDGVLTTTIPNNPSAAFVYGVPFAFEVTPGSHTIELRNVGSTYSDVDQIVLLPPTAPKGVGTYQEGDTGLTYSGNWTTVSNVGALGGSRRYTNDPNARVFFNTDASVGRVTIYRTTAGNTFGSMQVYVDGVLQSTFANNISSSVQYGVPNSFALSPGAHRIELRNVGSAFSDLDQIDLQPPPASLSVGVYQESNSELVYSGNWTSIAGGGALGGARRYTNDASGRVAFNIDGSVGRVTIYRTVAGSTFGTMQVYVDGILNSTMVNNTGSAVQYGVPFTIIVTPGSHTIELRNVGSKFGDLDQITLEAPSAALGINTYQETNAELTYIGSWTNIAGGGALGGTRRYTNDAGARVSFNVDSTVGKVTIYRTVAGSTFGVMQVYVDGVLNGTIANNTGSAVQYGVPYTFSIPPGSHTIELRNTVNKFSDLDQIELEAPTPALSVNTYQESTIELAYAGNWTNIAGGGALGGMRRYTNDPNARVSFNIDSSVGKVTIYRTVAGSTFGTMQVYVDGVLHSSMANNTSSTVQYGVPYTFAVAPGNHLIELRNGGATFSDIDQITLDGPPVSLSTTPGTYQESSNDLIYTGNWTTISNAGALGGSRRYTNQANARVSFTIDNSVGKVTIYRTVAGGTFGTMQVYVDGVLQSTIANNTSATIQYGVPYSFTVVPGSHTIELRNVSGTFSDLDQILLEAS